MLPGRSRTWRELLWVFAGPAVARETVSAPRSLMQKKSGFSTLRTSSSLGHSRLGAAKRRIRVIRKRVQDCRSSACIMACPPMRRERPSAAALLLLLLRGLQGLLGARLVLLLLLARGLATSRHHR